MIPLLKVPVIPYGDVASIDDSIAADREERDVHGVYEAIAPHFSSTRYKVREYAAYRNHTNLLILD